MKESENVENATEEKERLLQDIWGYLTHIEYHNGVALFSMIELREIMDRYSPLDKKIVHVDSRHL